MGKIRKSITIEEKVSEEIDKLAEKESRSFSSMIEMIVKKYINFKK